MVFPQRKSNRLTAYHYSQYGFYFLTLCTKDKKPILCDIRESNIFEQPKITFSKFGIIVKNQICAQQNFYSDIHIEKYVIMPNHIHMIVCISEDTAPASTPANDRIPFFISTLKRFTNKEAETDLWQRSYHDHVIRNDTDYQKIWKYIDDNPAKWNSDCFYIPSAQ